MKSTENKFVAVWMDHEKAHLIEPGIHPMMQTIHRSEKHNEHIAGESADGIKLGNFRSSNNEFHKHRKEENQFHLFCKQLSAGLKEFHTIYIFGPGTAHKEFRNYLKNDHHYLDKKIIEETTDYQTENQIKAKANSIYMETLNDVSITKQ